MRAPGKACVASSAFQTNDLDQRVRQALTNIVAVLAKGGARPEHFVRMTWYVTDQREYVAAYPEKPLVPSAAFRSAWNLTAHGHE